MTVRTVKEVKLFEVGPVAFPAYPTTSVGVRDLSTPDEAADALREEAGNEPAAPPVGTRSRARLLVALQLEKERP